MNDTPFATPPWGDGPDQDETTLSLMSLLVEQRQNWQRGQPVLVEAYLLRQPALTNDTEVVLDLIGNELVVRQELGETPQLEEYLARFPKWAAQIKIQFAVEQAIGSDTPARPTLVPGPAVSTLPARPPTAAGAHLLIPGYEILGVLGRGAMGLVYQARQVGLDRLVALKVILAGEAADAEERRRFRHEAEAVGRLQHPNIVQIHDVGEHAGQPYFALEFVPGGTLAQRLAGQPQAARQAAQWAATLAQAMQHAHQHGIVHRDLKPSNVLLSGEWGVGSGEKKVGPSALPTPHSPLPAPKITDFGLVKRLEAGASLTQTGAIVGTPSYMAPEQAAGKNQEVGPVSDVYALGAILYELLTGRPPFHAATTVETILQVLHDEPVPPRQLQPRLPRDLETICLKCLRKEPGRRYSSAMALAEDLGHFLRGEPIVARPTGRLERLAKWARRRPAVAALSGALVTATVLLIAGLATGILVIADALDQAQQAEQTATKARDEKAAALEKAKKSAQAERSANAAAQKRLGQIEKANTILTSVFRNLDPRLQDKDSPPLQAQLGKNLDTAAQLLEGEAVGDPLVVANLQLTLGNSQLQLGYPDRAILLFMKARQTFESQLGLDDPKTLTTMNNLAQAYRAAGQADKALPLIEQTVEKMKATLGPAHSDTLHAMTNLAAAYYDAKLLAKALPLFEEVLEKRKAMLGPDHLDTLTSMNNLAVAYKENWQLDKALPLYVEAFEKRQAKLGPDHPLTVQSMNNLAGAWYDAKQFGKALTLYEQSLEKTKSNLGPDHPDTLTAMHNLAVIYQNTGKASKALPLYEETLEKMKAKLGPNHPLTLNTMNNMAGIYRDAGQWGKALALIEQTFELRKAKLGPDHPDTLHSMSNLAVAYYATGQVSKALPLYEQTFDKMKAKLGADHPFTLNSMSNLAGVYRDTGHLDKALPLYEQALEKMKVNPGLDHFLTINTMRSLVVVYEKNQAFAKAELVWRDLIKVYRKPSVPNHGLTALALVGLGNVLLQQKKYAEAEPVLREGVDLSVKLAPDHWTTFSTKARLGVALLGQKKYAGAEALLLESCEGMKQRAAQIPATAKSLLAEAVQRLVDLYMAWDRAEDAARWRKELDTLQHPGTKPKQSEPESN